MKITPNLLKKYAEGTCSAVEGMAMEEWTQEITCIKPKISSSESEVRKQRIRAGVARVAYVKKKTFDPRKTWALAACVALLVVGVDLGLFNLFTSSPIIYSTAFGETQVITLEDGTTVTLNANSQLLIADDFGAQARSVQFSGEAYFQVAEKPFIIETDHSRTQALGTAFNLRSILDQPTNLTLEEGRWLFQH